SGPPGRGRSRLSCWSGWRPGCVSCAGCTRWGPPNGSTRKTVRVELLTGRVFADLTQAQAAVDAWWPRTTPDGGIRRWHAHPGAGVLVAGGRARRVAERFWTWEGAWPRRRWWSRTTTGGREGSNAQAPLQQAH